MIRKPILSFKNLLSTGLEDVPIDSFIHIEDIGLGKSKAIILINNDGIDDTTTIGDFLNLPAQYSNLDGGSEIEKLTEGTNTGWRLLGKDSSNFGEIGDEAIDFSSSSIESLEFGATGYMSFATGYSVKALGDYTFSGGNNSTATGDYSFAYGSYNTSLGNFSFTSGHGTFAGGISSFACGETTKSINDYSFSAGSWNVGTSTETILEIGIGIDFDNKANALEIYKSGKIIAPGLSITNIDSIFSLVTKEYADTKISVNADIEEGTASLITYDTKGLITSGADANLGDLGDVSFGVTPIQGQLLTYDETEGKWKAKSGTASTAITDFVSTEDQKIFMSPYTVGNVAVFVSGIKLNPYEYSATDGLIVELHIGVDISTWVQIISDDTAGGTLVYSNTPNLFTKPQRTTISTENNAIDFNLSNNFEITAIADIISVSDIADCTGQRGTIIISTAENITGWSSIFKFKTVPTGLTGEEVFDYFIQNETSIRIGRLV